LEVAGDDGIKWSMNVLIVVPTYNERESLPELVSQVMAQDGVRMLVVDDGSPDGTGSLAEELGQRHSGRLEVLHRTGRRGLGASYVEGLQRALASDAPVIAQMDADLSHDPRYLAEMVAATEQYDLVVGSRYLRGVSVVNWPLHRLALSVAANRYIRVVTGLPLQDCTSGFRCWRRDALERIRFDAIRSEKYAFLVEITYEAQRVGCHIVEVPIIFIERRRGVSKLSSKTLFESLILPWHLRFRDLRRPRQLLPVSRS